jgi:vacuolar-type H+-ATPase subunit H
LPDDREAAAKAGGEATTPAVARLLEAERQADEIVRRAREEAEGIVEKAKERARQVTAGLSQAAAQEGDTSGLQEGLERQKRLIMDEGKRRIESMRAAARARLHEAVGKLLSVLIGEP